MALPTIFTIKGHFLSDKIITDGVRKFKLNKEYNINPGYIFYFLLKKEISGYEILGIVLA